MDHFVLLTTKFGWAMVHQKPYAFLVWNNVQKT